MKIIPNFSKYCCNENGDIFDENGVIVKQTKNNASSYRSVWIQKDGDNNKSSQQVHRLIASAFFGDVAENMVVDHIDQNKSNNHISNLEIVSISENNRRSVVSTTSVTPHIEVVAVDEMNGSCISYRSIAEASASTSISEYMIKKMCNDSKIRTHRNPHITFKFSNRNANTDFTKKDFMRKIYVYDIIKNIQSEYSSVRECTQTTGLSKSIIHGRLKANRPEMLFPTMGYIVSNKRIHINNIPEYSTPEVELFKILRNNNILNRPDGAGIIVDMNDFSYEPIWSIRKYCSDRNLHREYFRRDVAEKIYKLKYIPFYNNEDKKYNMEYRNYLEKTIRQGHIKLL